MPLFRSLVDPSKTYVTTFAAETERLRLSDSWEEAADAESGDGDEVAASDVDGQEREQQA